MKKILLFIFFSAELSAQNAATNLYDYLNMAANDNGMNGNLLIVRQDKVLLKKSYGYADFENKIENTEASLFPLASISKTFTAVAILQLKEKNKLKLDDHFVTYFPEFPYPDITIRQMLSHTSGLPDTETILDSLIPKQPDKIFTIYDILPAVKLYAENHSLLFQAGERWRYSSVGFQLLALLVEKLSKETFAGYVRNYIFLPAKMTNTYVQMNLSQTKEKNRTSTYQFNNHFEMKLQNMADLRDWKEWTYNLTGLVGGNNVVSNTSDLLKYDKALYSGILLSQSSLDEAFTPTKLNNGENNKAVLGASCGLGWFIFDNATNGKIVWHSGSNPGVTTLFMRNISKKESYIILQNVTCPQNVYFGMLEIIQGKNLHYTKSLGYLYGKDMFSKGAEFALEHLNELKKDTLNYSLVESEVDRIGLEFSRTPYQDFSLEAYKTNTILFPNSWRAFDSYAKMVSKKTENMALAISMYQKSLELNPNNENGKIELDKLLKSKQKL